MATKQSLYVPDQMLREIMSESIRLDRSLSWIVQAAWRCARAEVSRFPAATREAAEDPAHGAPGSREPRPSPQVLEFLKGKFETPAH